MSDKNIKSTISSWSATNFAPRFAMTMEHNVDRVASHACVDDRTRAIAVLSACEIEFTGINSIQIPSTVTYAI